jgi:hypothetical protein
MSGLHLKNKKNKNHMNSIKIIKKFYSKKEALKAARYQKDLAKKSKEKVSIEIIEAYKVHSSIKSKIGSPGPDDFIIIIKRHTTSIIKKITKKVKMIVQKVFKPKLAAVLKRFMEVKTPTYTSKVFLSAAYNPNVIPLIVPFSLCSRV